MLFDRGSQFLVGGFLRHLWESFGDLVFGVVNVFEFVDVQVLQCLHFHSFSSLVSRRFDPQSLRRMKRSFNRGEPAFTNTKNARGLGDGYFKPINKITKSITNSST